MRSNFIIGILLVVLGIFTLSYEHFTYKTEEKVLEIGSLKATVEKEKSVPRSVIYVLGGAAIAVGLIWILRNNKKTN